MKKEALIKKLRAELKAQADPEYAARMRDYLKSEMPLYGMRAGDMRKVFSLSFHRVEIDSFEEYEEVIQALWEGDYREERHAAIDFARRFKKFRTREALPLYELMIRTGAWWDLVDWIAVDLIGGLLRDDPSVAEVLMQWSRSDDMWLRRAAIICQVRFKELTDEELLFAIIKPSLEHKVFWIRKAIGWALREYGKVNPESVKGFVADHNDQLSGLSKREALKYVD